VLAPPPPAAPSASDAPAGGLAVLEREAIRRALDDCAGNVRQAAQRLGISRATLYRRIHSGEI